MSSDPSKLIVGFKVDYDKLSSFEPIGSGAQATVYKASLYGQTVAVKKFRQENGYHDVKLIASLSHRNVIRL